MKPKVMLVEDDAEIRLALAEVLENLGYDVALAVHGRDGLQQLRRGLRPAVILLDVMMPVMDGIAFREEQLSDAEIARIPVVLITAMGQAEQTARELRTHAALAKPFAIADLVRILAAICGAPSLRATPPPRQLRVGA